MRERLVVPSLGEAVTSVVVDRWRVKVGDRVYAGQTLLELESDKATYEVRSLTDGTLSACYLVEGDAAREGDVLGDVTLDAPSMQPTVVASALDVAARPAPSLEAEMSRAADWEVRVLSIPDSAEPVALPAGWEPFAGVDSLRFLARRRRGS